MNKMMIVGTSALAFHGVDIEVNDTDIWGTTPSFNGEGVDYHQVPLEVLEMVWNNTGYVYPEDILAIKMSHLSWDIKWVKTLRHINLLRNLGYVYNRDLYLYMKEYHTSIHGDKNFLSLNKNNEDFFDDHVEYKYDHDYLHELVAYPHPPMYTNCLKDGEDVLIDHERFLDELSYGEQIRMFREEIAVIAVERWLVFGKLTWYTAYLAALKKTITNLTKGWANDFIIENIEHFIKPEYKYFSNILKTLEIDMSKVDMTPFHDLIESFGKDIDDVSMTDLVYALCENEIPDEFWPVEGSHSECCVYIDRLMSKAGYVHLEQDGGGEGGSEYCYGVFKLGDLIYKTEYSYYSYNGHEIDGIVESLRVVTPVEKTITVYE